MYRAQASGAAKSDQRTNSQCWRGHIDLAGSRGSLLGEGAELSLDCPQVQLYVDEPGSHADRGLKLAIGKGGAAPIRWQKILWPQRSVGLWSRKKG